MFITPHQIRTYKEAIMTDNTTPIETLFERAENLSKTTIKLLKLTAVDKSAEIVSALFSVLIVIVAVVLSIMIISVGLALWLGKLLGDSYYGFFIVGASYLFVAILFHVFRKQWLKYPISNSIIKKVLKENKI